ncbi:MAG TPA: LIC12162 family protein [Candidatus Ozemobacteraceae bacterium]
MELVLTGYQPLWPADESNAVFLGPWCFADNSRRPFGQQTEFRLIPPPSGNKCDLVRDVEKIDHITDRVLPVLAERLNAWYGTRFSERFWKISTIAWLSFWIGLLYERFARLSNAADVLGSGGYVVTIPRHALTSPPEDYNQAANTSHLHEFNLDVFAMICRVHAFPGMELRERELPADGAWREKVAGLSGSCQPISPGIVRQVEAFLDRLWKNVIRPEVHWGKVYGVTLGDRLFFDWRLWRRTGRRCPRLEPIVPQTGEMDAFRREPLSFGGETPFEKIVEKLLPKIVPAAVLREIPPLEREERVRLWVGNDIWQQREAFKIARVVEGGGAWVSVQHGAGYGQGMPFPNGKVEYEASGNFISWGWTHEHFYPCRVIPLPSPMLSKLPERKLSDSSILLVGIGYPVYRYRPIYSLKPEEILPYLKDRETFILNIDTHLKLHVRFKPYFRDYGEDSVGALRGVLDSTQILDPRSSVGSCLATARVVVVDHLGTTLSESMAANVPTIAFWRPEHFAVCDEAKFAFEALRAVGILHDSPESAAVKLNQIFNDLERWWADPAVQRARNLFLDHSGMAAADWRFRWLTRIRELLNEEPLAPQGNP